MFREAVMLHYLDDLDSKMAALRSALDSEQGEGNWTAFSGALGRRILRANRFLAAPDANPTTSSEAKTAAGGGRSTDGNE